MSDLDPSALSGVKEVRASTGIPGLDEVLNGGLPIEHFYLIEGRPGTGKTTLALQFLLEGLKQGEAGLYVTLSETKQELAAVARSHGWSLDGVSLFELATAAEENVLPEGQYTFFHPSEVELGETTKSLIQEVERLRPRRVVFDSLSEMRLLARDPLRYRRQVLGLKQFFTGRQCTVLVLDDMTSSNDDLQPQSIAHGVVTLEQLAPEYGAERRRLRICKLRGVNFRGGYHDYTIEQGGLAVFPRLVAAEHGLPYEKALIGSGSEALDMLLGGGIDRASSTLFIGPAGSGKSSLAGMFAVSAAARGEKSVIFVFDENVRTYLERSDGLSLPIRAGVDDGLIRLKQVDPAELSPGEFTHYVRTAVTDFGARMVIIDSLSGYMHAMPAENFLVLHMHEMLTYLSQVGVTTLLLMAQHGMYGPRLETNNIDLSYLADTAILFRHFETRGRLRKAISVIKKRMGRHEDTIRELRLSSSGPAIGEPLSHFHGILTGVPEYRNEVAEISEDGDLGHK